MPKRRFTTEQIIVSVSKTEVAEPIMDVPTSLPLAGIGRWGEGQNEKLAQGLVEVMSPPALTSMMGPLGLAAFRS